MLGTAKPSQDWTLDWVPESVLDSLRDNNNKTDRNLWRSMVHAGRREPKNSNTPLKKPFLHLSAEVCRSFQQRSGSAQSGTKSVLLIFNDGDAGELTEWTVTPFSCTSLNISNCLVCNGSYYLNNKMGPVCYGLIFQGLCSLVGGAALGGGGVFHCCTRLSPLTVF